MLYGRSNYWGVRGRAESQSRSHWTTRLEKRGFLCKRLPVRCRRQSIRVSHRRACARRRNGRRNWGWRKCPEKKSRSACCRRRVWRRSEAWLGVRAERQRRGFFAPWWKQPCGKSVRRRRAKPCMGSWTRRLRSWRRTDCVFVWKRCLELCCACCVWFPWLLLWHLWLP